MTSPRELADRFYAASNVHNPLEASYMGIPGYDHLMPDDSEAGHAAWRTDLGDILRVAGSIDPATLDHEDQVTLGCLTVFAEEERLYIDSGGAEHQVSPMPFTSPANFFAVAARTVIADEPAAEAYLTRLEATGPWLDQMADRLRAGRAKGRLPVAPLATATVEWADALLEDPVPAPVAAPEPPAGWAGGDRWRARRDEIATETLRPALVRWTDTVRELLPECRPADRPGLVHIPGGEEDYLRAIRVHTTLPLTADEIHRTGLEQVASLETRAVEVGAELGLSGIEDVRAGIRASGERVSPAVAIQAAVDAIRRAEARAGEVFPAPLPPPCDVRPMPEVVAVSGTAPHYTPPVADGTRPGTYWFNTMVPTAGTGWELEVVAFHEAVPGHHLQFARIQQLAHLTELQRNRYLTVFSEGWGLYSEQLAGEIGLYQTPESRLGAIAASLMRAARLVVDSGLHAFGWSRAQAMEYFDTHVPLPAEFVRSEIDRYIVMPGQALSYLTGKLQILDARDRARARLGSAFDLPAFHAALLDSGSLPMPVLHEHIDWWVQSRLAPRSGHRD